MTQTPDATSLYERIGGAPAIQAAAELFYRKVLSDERISSYFDDIDMDQQVAKQAAFLTMALGGPTNYTDRDLRTAHAHLVDQGLTDSDFDAVLDHLAATLRELAVAETEVAEVVQVADSVRGEVLNR